MRKISSQSFDISEYEDFIKEVDSNKSLKWQSLIESIDADPNTLSIADSIKYLGSRISSQADNIRSSKEKLNLLGHDDIVKAIDKVSGALKLATSSRYPMLKTASIDVGHAFFNDLDESLINDSIEFIIQSSSKSISKTASSSKLIGLIPGISVIYDIIMTLRGMYYSITSFLKIMKDAELIGLRPIDVLSADKLSSAVSDNNSNPDSLATIVLLAKSASMFYKEGLSAAINALSAIWDTIALLSGIGLAIDIFVTILAIGAEYGGGEIITSDYNEILSDIRTIALTNV